MNIPITNKEDYKFHRHLGYMYGDNHGIYNFYYAEVWNYTSHFYIKRIIDLTPEHEANKEGISIQWKGNPFKLNM